MGYRVAIDCVDIMEEKGCTIHISGTEEEVLTLAVRHFTKIHKNKDSKMLRQKIKAFIKPDES